MPSVTMFTWLISLFSFIIAVIGFINNYPSNPPQSLNDLYYKEWVPYLFISIYVILILILTCVHVICVNKPMDDETKDRARQTYDESIRDKVPEYILRRGGYTHPYDKSILSQIYHT